MFITRFLAFKKSWHSTLALKSLNQGSGLGSLLLAGHTTADSASFNTGFLLAAAMIWDFRVLNSAKMCLDEHQSTSDSTDLSAVRKMFRKNTFLQLSNTGNVAVKDGLENTATLLGHKYSTLKEFKCFYIFEILKWEGVVNLSLKTGSAPNLNSLFAI